MKILGGRKLLEQDQYNGVARGRAYSRLSGRSEVEQILNRAALRRSRLHPTRRCAAPSRFSWDASWRTSS